MQFLKNIWAGIWWSVLLFFPGCISSTKFIVEPGGCRQALVANQKILVAEAQGLSSHESYNLYEKLKEAFREKDLHLNYAVENEFDLLARGIKPQPDTANLTAMHRAGYDYYLVLTVSDRQDGAFYEHVSAGELKELAAKQKSYEPENEGSKAKLSLALYATKEQQVIYRQTTITTMRALGLPGKKGGQAYYNTSDNIMALHKALRKSAKKLQKDCRCC